MYESAVPLRTPENKQQSKNRSRKDAPRIMQMVVVFLFYLQGVTNTNYFHKGTKVNAMDIRTGLLRFLKVPNKNKLGKAAGNRFSTGTMLMSSPPPLCRTF
jgi:hypothetical protein